MTWKVLIAHAEGEDELAEKLAEPLSDAGYEVAHQGSVLVGESIIEEASKVLSMGGPVILCATVKAIGTGLPIRLVGAARLDAEKRVFIVQMEKDAFVGGVAFGDKIAKYWQDGDKAIRDLLAALNRYFPLDEEKANVKQFNEAEQRYCDLLLATCDIVNLGNLPEDRKIVQQPLALRRLYVPLRVQVEVEAGDKIEWEELEKRRLALMKGNIDTKEISHKRERFSVGERLAKSQRLVILGDPGTGKTTITRWISTAYLLRRKSDPAWKDLPDIKTLPDFDLLPIVIRCRDLKENCLDGSLEDILHHTFRKAELTLAEADALKIVLRKRLREGTALLIIDGLDEIADPSTRSRFCQQLENIHLAYPNAPILVTSRIVGYREMGYRMGRGFEHVTIADFTPKEKDDFASRWCELTELPENKANATDDLIHDIHSSDRIERMTGNPMLLTTLALVRRKVGKLPSRRAELYWEAVQVLLNWRSDVDKPIDTSEAIPQLGYVAYDMCVHGVQQIRRDTILELITRMRDEYPNLHQTRNSMPENFLSRLEARTGLIIEAGHTHDRGMDIPLYEFRHLTFQEYLAARALVDGCFPGRDVNRSLANYIAPLAGCTITEEPLTKKGIKEVEVAENWREALRLCSSICCNDDVDSVLLAILTPLELETEETSRARSILATLCIADEPNVSETTVQRIFQEFAQNIKKSDGGSRVITGADKAAFEVAGTRWASHLSTALAREYCRRKDVDRYEVGSLCGLVCTSNVQTTGIPTDDWLQQLTKNISNYDGPEAIKAALAVMRLAYENAVDISPNLTDSLIQKIKGSEPLAQASAWALAWLAFGFISSQNSGPKNNHCPPWIKPIRIHLSELFEGSSWAPMSRDVRCISSIIIDSNLNQEALKFIIWTIESKSNFFEIELLIALSNHPSPIVRSNLIEALGIIISEETVEPVVSGLNDSDANVRKAAVSALGNFAAFGQRFIEIKRAMELLTSRLDDPDAIVREAAASALGEAAAILHAATENENAIEPLILRLDDSDASVRKAAASALGYIKSERASEPLILKLDDVDASMREAAASALGSIKSERAIEPLILRLDDSDASVRKAAASALGDIKSERASEPLILRLDDSDASVRKAAASALGGIKSGCASEPLILKLDDVDASMREAVASALGSIKSERAIEPLILRLDDSDASVRKAAASALGDIKSERASEPLILRLDDSDASVRKAVASALGEIKSERAIEQLISKLDDADASVRKAAASALGAIESESAIEPLISKLDDADASVRKAAVSALGAIESESAIEPLISKLDDADASVRKAAVSALGGDMAALALNDAKNECIIKPLMLRLDDSDADVREAAASALVTIKTKRLAIQRLLPRFGQMILRSSKL